MSGRKSTRTPEEQRQARRESSRRYYANHRQERCAASAAWYASHEDWRRRYNATYKAAHVEKSRVQQKAYRATDAFLRSKSGYQATAKLSLTIPTRRIWSLVGNARRRARKLGIAFEPGIADVLMREPPLSCPCCNLPIDYEFSLSQGKGFAARSPSLDRTDNARGYVVGNVAVLCLRCNMLKRDASLIEMENVVAYLRRQGTLA